MEMENVLFIDHGSIEMDHFHVLLLQSSLDMYQHVQSFCFQSVLNKTFIHVLLQFDPTGDATRMVQDDDRDGRDSCTSENVKRNFAIRVFWGYPIFRFVTGYLRVIYDGYQVLSCSKADERLHQCMALCFPTPATW